MMTRSLLTAALVALALPLLGAQALHAQRAPNISGPKNAATRAAAATNAHTTAEQAVDGQPQPAVVRQPQASAPATGRATTKAGKGAADSATSMSTRGAKGEMTFTREVYDYDAGGRRDPFVSLISSGDLRPLFTDLKLVTIIYDATGRNSVAILRDLSTKDQYRVRVGQTLGRMRIASIQPKQVGFIIEEFGYSRQESLALSDTTQVRKQ